MRPFTSWALKDSGAAAASLVAQRKGELLVDLPALLALLRLLGFENEGAFSFGDRPKVLRLLAALGVDSDTCWLITRQLVQLHRERIAAVAQALLERGELSADEIDQLMRPT